MPMYNNPYALSKSTIRRRKRAAYVATPNHNCPSCGTPYPHARTPHVFIALPRKTGEPLRLGCRKCIQYESMTQAQIDAEQLLKCSVVDSVRIENAIAKLNALKRLCDENSNSLYSIDVYEAPGEKQHYEFSIIERETGAIIKVSSGHTSYIAAVEDALSNVERLNDARTA